MIDGINRSKSAALCERLAEANGWTQYYFADIATPSGRLIDAFEKRTVVLCPDADDAADIASMYYAINLLEQRAGMEEALSRGRTVIINGYMYSIVTCQSVQQGIYDQYTFVDTLLRRMPKPDVSILLSDDVGIGYMIRDSTSNILFDRVVSTVDRTEDEVFEKVNSILHA